MREFICTVKIRLREGQPTKKALERLHMELLGYSEVEVPKPTTQIISVAGLDSQEFGKF
jgi:hypothetical protein